jgi:hypothetical protein
MKYCGPSIVEKMLRVPSISIKEEPVTKKSAYFASILIVDKLSTLPSSRVVSQI